MKVLTIKEPWATLIIEGYKKYEFRSWKTNYRGKILIHAGMSFDKEVLNRFESYNLNYNNGSIIGEAEITDCILVDEKFDNELNLLNGEVYGANSHVGKYAFLIKNVKKYEEPIYVKGKLGLWNYEWLVKIIDDINNSNFKNKYWKKGE